MLTLLRDSCLSAKGQRTLLDFLLTHGLAAAVSYAEELISLGYSNDEQKCLLIEFCTGLMAGVCNYDWSTVWNAITSNEDLGRAIVEKCAKEDGFKGKFGAQLSARELADLYLWTQERYPAAEDPEIDGVHALSIREQVGRWRNSLINQISAKGGEDALREIRRIIARFPELEWLNMTRIDLEKAVAESNWSPLSPPEILQLAESDDGWLKRCGRVALRVAYSSRKFVMGYLARELPGWFS